MLRVGHNLKRLFKRTNNHHPFLPFKQFNYLHSVDPAHLSDLLRFSEQHHFFQITPEIMDKQVLFVSYPLTVSLIEKLLKKKPSMLMNYQVNFNTKLNEPGLYSVKGNLIPLGVKTNTFDVIVLPVASIYQKEFIDFFPSISMALKNGGRVVLSVIHPALELLLYNQNPASASRAQTSLQSYFTALKESNLYLEGVVEGTIDKQTKAFFQEPAYFEEFKGLPLVLFLRAVKFVKD